MKLTPLFNNVIVKPLAREEMTKSGLVLPDSSDKDKPEQGEVVAIGSGRVMDNGQVLKMSVKIGDRIVFKKYSPDEVKIEDEKYLVLSESDIIAIVE